MHLPLAYYGNPVLRKKGEPVITFDDALHQLVDHMFETMEIENGIGLAAPQIHRSLRLFVMQVPIKNEDETWDPGIKRVFINPTILSVDQEQDVLEEGCLSLPDLRGDVVRPISVNIEAVDADGKPFTVELKGLEARCALHENDHINGKLFIDRMDKRDRKKLEKGLRELKKKYG